MKQLRSAVKLSSSCQFQRMTSPHAHLQDTHVSVPCDAALLHYIRYTYVCLCISKRVGNYKC